MKKVLGILLAGAMVASVAATSLVSAGAVKTNHSKYTPSAGTETYKYYFAMPGCWINDSTKDNNDAAGCYWWDATDSPGDKFSNGWPGYEMDKEAAAENLYSINAPRDAANVVFSNYLDGGMDSSLPVFAEALQCKNSSAEFYCEGDSKYYSEKFWKYMWSLAQQKAGIKEDNENFDATYEYILAHPEVVDFTPEFGDNGKMFFSETDLEFGLSMRFDNMIWIVDLDPSKIEYINQDLIPGGKPAFSGEWYFMYGNGEYGMWPTKALALEQSGVTQNEDGTYTVPEGGKIDEYGTVYDADGYVVVGNYTGKYYQDKVAPEAPSKPAETTVPATTVAPTTVPGPDNNDADSSTSDSTQDTPASESGSDNNAIQTGAASFAIVMLIAAVGVVVAVYFKRRKTN